MAWTIKSHYGELAVRKEVSICRRHVPDIVEIAASSIRTVSSNRDSDYFIPLTSKLKICDYKKLTGYLPAK